MLYLFIVVLLHKVHVRKVICKNKFEFSRISYVNDIKEIKSKIMNP